MDDRHSFEAEGDIAASGWSARNVRAIKAAVYIMGVLIVIAAVALVAAIVMKAERGGKMAAAGFGDLEVAVPAGATVTGSRLDGDRLVIDMSSPRGGEVVIVDVKKGRVLGRVKLTPAAK